MKVFVFLFTIFAISDIFAQKEDPSTVEHVELKNTLKWSKTKSDSVVFTTSGKYISGVVETCDVGVILDSNQNPVFESYLLLKTGNEKSTEEDDARVFVNIKNPKSFYFASTKVYLEFKADSTNTVPCTVTFETADDERIPTTTQPPTTTGKWPISEDGYLIVNISGRPINDFNDKDLVSNLKKTVLKMASDYISTNISSKCVIKEEITYEDASKDVLFKYIQECPLNWPDFQTCVKIKLSVPVDFENEENITECTGYQLSTYHLEKMWGYLSDEYLEKIKLQNYKLPKFEEITEYWGIGIALVTILFIILVIMFKYVLTNFHLGQRMRSKLHDLKDGKRRSTDPFRESLGPHYLQDTPRIFGDGVQSTVYESIGEDNKAFEMDF